MIFSSLKNTKYENYDIANLKQIDVILIYNLFSLFLYTFHGREEHTFQ